MENDITSRLHLKLRRWTDTELLPRLCYLPLPLIYLIDLESGEWSTITNTAAVIYKRIETVISVNLYECMTMLSKDIQPELRSRKCITVRNHIILTYTATKL